MLVFLADVCGIVVRVVVCVGLLCIACGFVWLVVIAGILTRLVRFGVVVISGVFEFAFMLLAWRMLCGVLLVVLLLGGVCVLVVAGIMVCFLVDVVDLFGLRVVYISTVWGFVCCWLLFRCVVVIYCL